MTRMRIGLDGGFEADIEIDRAMNTKM